MKNNILYLSFFLLLLVLVGCSDENHDYSELQNNDWKLVYVSTRDGGVHPLRQNPHLKDCFTFSFYGDNGEKDWAGGNTGCNNYTGHYELQGQKFKYESKWIEAVYCPFNDDNTFLDLLNKTIKYAVKDDYLHFYTADKQEYMVFKKETAFKKAFVDPILEEKLWRLKTIYTETHGEWTVDRNKWGEPLLLYEYSVLFTPTDGRIIMEGSGFCNGFSSWCILGESSLKLDNLYMPSDACSRQDRDEKLFFSLIKRTNKYELKDGLLYLYTDNEKDYMVLEGKNIWQ